MTQVIMPTDSGFNPWPETMKDVDGWYRNNISASWLALIQRHYAMIPAEFRFTTATDRVHRPRIIAGAYADISNLWYPTATLAASPSTLSAFYVDNGWPAVEAGTNGGGGTIYLNEPTLAADR